MTRVRQVTGEIFIGGRWKGQLDGGHTKKRVFNESGIGICLIGNFELRSPTANSTHLKDFASIL